MWDKRASYIEQSTSALQRYVALGDEYARHTRMQMYTPKQTQEADISLYERLLKDEQKVGPGRMPERSSGTATTSLDAGWGPRHLAISGVSHQPFIQTAHHTGSNAYDGGNVGIIIPPLPNAPLQGQAVGHDPGTNTTGTTAYASASSNDANQTPLQKKALLTNNPHQGGTFKADRIAKKSGKSALVIAPKSATKKAKRKVDLSGAGPSSDPLMTGTATGSIPATVPIPGDASNPTMQTSISTSGRVRKKNGKYVN